MSKGHEGIYSPTWSSVPFLPPALPAIPGALSAPLPLPRGVITASCPWAPGASLRTAPPLQTGHPWNSSVPCLERHSFPVGLRHRGPCSGHSQLIEVGSVTRKFQFFKNTEVDRCQYEAGGLTLRPRSATSPFSALLVNASNSPKLHCPASKALGIQIPNCIHAHCSNSPPSPSQAFLELHCPPRPHTQPPTQCLASAST